MSMWSTRKPSPDDMLIRITVVNRGPETATCTCCRRSGFAIPGPGDGRAKAIGRSPSIARDGRRSRAHARIAGRHSASRWTDATELLFTDNETNAERLFGMHEPAHHVKDAFHEYVVHGRTEAVNPRRLAPKRRRTTSWRFRRQGEVAAAFPAGSRRNRRQRPSVRDFDGSSTPAHCAKRMSFTPPFWTPRCPRSREDGRAAGLRRPALVASSFITTPSRTGWRATPASRRRPRAAGTAATTTGPICSTATSSPCRIPGSIPGTPPGISRST